MRCELRNRAVAKRWRNDPSFANCQPPIYRGWRMAKRAGEPPAGGTCAKEWGSPARLRWPGCDSSVTRGMGSVSADVYMGTEEWVDQFPGLHKKTRLGVPRCWSMAWPWHVAGCASARPGFLANRVRIAGLNNGIGPQIAKNTLGASPPQGHAGAPRHHTRRPGA